MMNGYNNKSLFEKIMIIILMFIASPFIIGSFIIFVLVYFIIYPFEIIFYKRSYYYKNLLDKYYLFVTFNNKYKLYNKIYKYGKKELLDGEDVYKYNNYIIHNYNLNTISLLDDKIILNNKNNFINIIVISKELLSVEQFKKINKQSNVIIYDK